MFTPRSLRVSLLLLPALALSASLAWASWPTVPTTFDPVCVVTGAVRVGPSLESAEDGAGGAYFAWTDFRASWPSGRICLQHMSANGVPEWGDSGRVLSNSAAKQDAPLLVPDGAGGVIVVWRDFRADTAGDLYAQRIDAAFSKHWAAGDVPVCSVPLAHPRQAQASSDGAGGVLVTWQDDRVLFADHAYAQRIDHAGTPLWTAEGVDAPLGSAKCAYPNVASDGAGGALLVWTVLDGSGEAIAQRLDATGARLWDAGGVALSNGVGGEFFASAIGDGAGGGLFAWRDARSLNGWLQSFAQGVNAGGTVQWGAGALGLSGSQWPVMDTKILSDGAGGAIVTWFDYENDGVNNLFAQRLDAAGAPQWGAARLIATAYGEPGWGRRASVSDGQGGFVCAWTTTDGGNNANYQVRAQRVAADGGLSWGAGGTLLASGVGIRTGTVIATDGSHGAIVAWTDFSNGFLPAYFAAQVNAAGVLGQRVTAVPPAAPAGFALSRAWPTPAPVGGAIALRCSLPAPARVRLAIYDAGGRRVAVLADGARDAGIWTARWDGRDAAGHAAAPGLYFARLDALGRSASTELVIAR